MEVETNINGYKISLPAPKGKIKHYAFRRRGSADIEIHSAFKSGGCIVNYYRKSNGCWIDAVFNYYRIKEGSLEYIAFEKLSNIMP